MTVPSPKNSEWVARDSLPNLNDDEVHLWLVSLAADDGGQLQELRGRLTRDEQEKAGRFLFEKHRVRFIAGRARLRQLLGLYRHVGPLGVEFQYDGLGKPSFAGSSQGVGLCFNFSNSDQAALLAVARNVELGVDIERVRPLTNLEGLADRFFTKAETDQILAVDGLAQQETFFRCWTRKEAYLKAVGKGLTFPLNQMQVTVADHEPAKIVSIHANEALAVGWQLHHLQPEAGYFGALAYRSQQVKISRFRWCG